MRWSAAPAMFNLALPPPRPFQSTTHVALREGIAAGHRCQMVCAPTGSGKTIFAMYLVAECMKRGKRAIFVADRITLIDQTSVTAARVGLRPHGIIQARHPLEDWSQPFQIASAQTLARRRWPPADLIIIDEAHTQLSAWTDHIGRTDAVVVGLSATPFSTGLGRLFSRVINATTMAELVAQRTLVPLRVFAAVRADMRGAATAGGEWTDTAAEQRGMQIVGDVVREWMRHGGNRKTICFGATIKHCEELCRQFNSAGIAAAVYCANTPDVLRAQMLDEYRKPDSFLRVLVSVEALAKGFDVPDVSCIIDCRPLRKSFSTWVQMVGRGLRASPDTGKVDCLLLDHSGNARRFAADFSDLYHDGVQALDTAEKLDRTVRNDADDDRDPCACPACGFSPFAKRCIACGFARPVIAQIAHVDGMLQEVILGGKKLAANRRDLFNQLVAYARRHSAPHQQLWRAKYLYRDMVGALPPAGWTLDNTPDTMPTPETVSRIRALNIRRAKGLAKGGR